MASKVMLIQNSKIWVQFLVAGDLLVMVLGVIIHQQKQFRTQKIQVILQDIIILVVIILISI
ncbi:hypothetical protein D3C87_1977690 [compost metagenome]